MCLCHPPSGRGPVQLGIPLNEDTYADMKHSEVLFWEAFLKQATIEKDQAEDAAQAIPYQPSGTLLEMFRRAIGEFKGEQYCQVQQLKDFFDFKPAN